MLVTWEEAYTSAIIERVEARGGTASRRLLTLFELVIDSDGRLEMAMRAWAAVDGKAKRAVRRVDRQRLLYLERLLRDIGLPKPVAIARSRLVYYALIGAFSLGIPASRAARLNHAMIVGTG